jgi:hypothetical protein
LQNTRYRGDKTFQTHEELYSYPPLFSFTQKARTASFVSSNRYTTKAFEYSQVARTSNFATAMGRGLKPLDPFLPHSLPPLESLTLRPSSSSSSSSRQDPKHNTKSHLHIKNRFKLLLSSTESVKFAYFFLSPLSAFLQTPPSKLDY